MIKIILAGVFLLELAFLSPLARVQAAVVTPAATPVATVVQSQPVNLQNTVVIQNSQFIPSTIQVTPGTIVTWMNQDSVAHTVTSDSTTTAEVWDSGNLSPGQSYSRTFTQQGTYPYHCNTHLVMRGVVQVVPANTLVQPVTTVTSTQLPSTGVPPVAYSVIGLIPIGWMLIKYRRMLREDKTASGLWQKRQFKLLK
jgi:plastocyanin